MLFSWLARIAMACWRPVARYARMKKDDGGSGSGNDDLELGIGGGDGGGADSLLWSRDLEKHSCGDFSFAVVQANAVIEDHSQVETGRDAVFVGVYDGHGGPEAARFISDHLFKNLMNAARERGTISEDALRRAFSATEDGFLTLVRRSYGIKPVMAAIGSCCLAGVIWNGTLYVANVGDSRAVVGSLRRSKKIVSEQLTNDHNACMEEVRQELRSLHPDDSQILVQKQGVWRIKGIIQVSRSIGDAYLKRPEFSLDPTFPRFHLPEPVRRPVLTSEPSLLSRVLQPEDKFLIFASDGLWDLISNQEAVEIVYNNKRTGIARRLVEAALNKACKQRSIKYRELTQKAGGERRGYHDDITVVVIFIDNHHHEGQQNVAPVPEISVRGFIDSVGPSDFSIPSS